MGDKITFEKVSNFEDPILWFASIRTAETFFFALHPYFYEKEVNFWKKDPFEYLRHIA